MYFKTQCGFTLTELIMAILVIGILATIAIPTYQHYAAKAQVAEAFTLSGNVKNEVTRYWECTGRFPTDNAATGLVEPESITGSYVNSVTVNNGTITVQMKSSGAVKKSIAGKTVALIPKAGDHTIKWSYGPGSENPIPISFLPYSIPGNGVIEYEY